MEKTADIQNNNFGTQIIFSTLEFDHTVWSITRRNLC